MTEGYDKVDVLVLSGINSLKLVRFLSWYCGTITVL